MFVLLSVRDVVAGWFITIVRTDDDEVYYFGYYDFEEHWYVTQLEGDLYPRDLMANIGREDSYGAVSLEYDNDEISVTGDVTETSGKICVSDINFLSPTKIWAPRMPQRGWCPIWLWDMVRSGSQCVFCSLLRCSRFCMGDGICLSWDNLCLLCPHAEDRSLEEELSKRCHSFPNGIWKPSSQSLTK